MDNKDVLSSEQKSLSFGLIGEKLEHSWSPAIHAQLAAESYELVELAPWEVGSFFEAKNFQGINVTIPYKKRAFEAADAASEAAQLARAANTLVVRPDGTLFADNTDLAGFRWLLEHNCKDGLGLSAQELIEGHDVVVFGATGGAAQAVKQVLGSYQPHTILEVSRTGALNYTNLEEAAREAVLLVNCTPQGMYPQVSKSPASHETIAALSHLKLVLDLIYNPLQTLLVGYAQDQGIAASGGLGMLVAQALFSSELFHNTTHDASLIPDITEHILSKRHNIALIGMPGSGKTGAGRRLAHKMGRPFVDIDDICAIKTGTTSANYIAEHGEAAFRDLEASLVERYAKETGLVIACGGGVVMRPENRDLLRLNSKIVFINRSLDELSTEDRPITAAYGIEKLAELRLPLYRAWADFTLDCTGSAAGDAAALEQWYTQGGFLA